MLVKSRQMHTISAGIAATDDMFLGFTLMKAGNIGWVTLASLMSMTTNHLHFQRANYVNASI